MNVQIEQIKQIYRLPPFSIAGQTVVTLMISTIGVYKKAWSHENAIQYIKDQYGIDFDPFLVDKFMQITDDVIEF